MTSSPSSTDYRRSLPIVALIAVLWGINWPMFKYALADLHPLTFRATTLPLAGLALLAIARLQGSRLTVPRALLGRLFVLAMFNVTVWNALLLFGMRSMEAGRAAILAYTMPMWALLLSSVVLREPLDRRRVGGLVLGLAAMALLLGDDLRIVGRSPVPTLLISVAAVSWALGTVLLRAWKLALPPSTATAWLMLIGCVPLALLAPLFDPAPIASLRAASLPAWIAVVYNILIAGAICQWAWFRLAQTLPVAVSSLSSMSVPVVGVMSGMILLGERPGPAEYAALALVALALATLYWPAQTKRTA